MRYHNIEQRMARWLLLCSDRVGDRVLSLSHEYMADMLGVTRSSVTVVAGHLQERGLDPVHARQDYAARSSGAGSDFV